MYANRIYATPDTWGSQTVYGDVPAMQATIASLIDAGGPDWNGIELGDCAEWELVQEINGVGLYQERGVRHESYIALEAADGGEYTEVYFTGLFGRRIATWSDRDEAVTELEERMAAELPA